MSFSNSRIQKSNVINKFKEECLLLNSKYESILDQKNICYEAVIIDKKYKDIYDLYKKQKRAFWDIDEIDFSKDRDGYISLNENERHFIKYVLALFVYNDEIVNQTIGRFMEDVSILGSQMFYRFQSVMQDIHSITYSLMIKTLISDSKKIKELQNSVKTIQVLSKKKEWFEYWIGSEKTPFHVRLLAFAIVEGIFFSASFCAIYWIKEKKKNIIPGLTQSNELISRDKRLHSTHAVLLFKHLENKPSQELVYAIIRKAVKIETEFITESLPCTLIGMSCEKMSEYIQYVADKLLLQLEYKKLYNTKNPFQWID